MFSLFVVQFFLASYQIVPVKQAAASKQKHGHDCYDMLYERECFLDYRVRKSDDGDALLIQLTTEMFSTTAQTNVSGEHSVAISTNTMLQVAAPPETYQTLFIPVVLLYLLTTLRYEVLWENEKSKLICFN